MFRKIFEWVKEWVNKMIGKTNVKQALSVDVAISAPMVEALEIWTRMYENKAPWLNSSVYRTGVEDVYSMNLAAAISGEVARAVTIEMQAEFSGSPRADYLKGEFERVLTKLREQVEFGCAKGGLVFKPYLSKGRIAIDFVHADQFYPVSFDQDGDITGVVFVDQRQVGDKYFTRLEYHNMTENGCEIVNQAWRSNTKDMLGSKVSLESVADWETIEPEATITGIERPLFAYFRYPLANNIDSSSPLGVSCYSRAVDLIRQADLQWSNLLWEFEAGQTAIFVDELAFGRDTDGKSRLPHKRLYRSIGLDGNIGDSASYFHDWSPTLREQSILNGLEAILKRIEYACGLAYGTLSDPNSVDKTATEIKISRQRTYATITDTQKALGKALDQLVWAMDTWVTLGSLAPQGEYEVKYDWDDSVIVDKDTQMMVDRQAVSMGLMPKWRFLVRNYGLPEAEANQWIDEVENNRANFADMFPVEE